MPTDKVTTERKESIGNNTATAPVMLSAGPCFESEELSAIMARTIVPTNGNKGISQRGIIFALPLHVRVVININAFLTLENQNNHREPNACFCCGYGNGKKG